MHKYFDNFQVVGPTINKNKAQIHDVSPSASPSQNLQWQIALQLCRIVVDGLGTNNDDTVLLCLPPPLIIGVHEEKHRDGGHSNKLGP